MLSLSKDISSFLPTDLEFSFKEFVHSFYISGLGSLMSTISRVDSLDAQGIDLLTRHHVSNNISAAEAEAGVSIGCSVGKTECRSHPYGHIEIPCLCPFKTNYRWSENWYLDSPYKACHIQIIWRTDSTHIARSCRCRLDEIQNTQVEYWTTNIRHWWIR